MVVATCRYATNDRPSINSSSMATVYVPAGCTSSTDESENGRSNVTVSWTVRIYALIFSAQSLATWLLASVAPGIVAHPFFTTRSPLVQEEAVLMAATRSASCGSRFDWSTQIRDSAATMSVLDWSAAMV